MTLRFKARRGLPARPRLLRLARGVCRALPALRGPGEIVVRFLSDREIRAVNRSFLRHDYATDVISFNYPLRPRSPLRGASGTTDGLQGRKPRSPSRRADTPFGDICISIDTAARQAREAGHGLAHELAWLLAHGLLHLAGWEDDGVKRRRRMFARQAALIRKLSPDLLPADAP